MQKNINKKSKSYLKRQSFPAKCARTQAQAGSADADGARPPNWPGAKCCQPGPVQTVRAWSAWSRDHVGGDVGGHFARRSTPPRPPSCSSCRRRRGGRRFGSCTTPLQEDDRRRFGAGVFGAEIWAEGWIPRAKRHAVSTDCYCSRRRGRTSAGVWSLGWPTLLSDLEFAYNLFC